MKKQFMTVALSVGLAAAFVVLLAAQSEDDAIMQLRKQVADLGLRVSNLEHAAGKSSVPAGSQDGSSAATPARTMILVSISKSDHSGDHAKEIAGLQRQVTSLMNTVNASADQTAADAGQQMYGGYVRGGVRGWGAAAGGGYATTNVGSIGRQVIADHEVTNRYATQMAIQKEKLDRLRHADSMSRQIVLGHDGNTILTLETKFDLSTPLDEIAIGDEVTWTGTRQSADDQSETWIIETIRKVDSR